MARDFLFARISAQFSFRLSSRRLRLFSNRNALLSCLLSAGLLSGCSNADLPLGQELPQPNDAETAQRISDLLIGHLQQQYAGQDVLRDTHPKDNGCIYGTMHINSDIDPHFQHGVFQPGAQYPLWMRFSNSVEEITDDHEDDFRGLALKLGQVEGERLPLPGDEQHSQDFLFLGHDAFFAADAEEFFDFFDANFNGSRLWFLATHPRGAWNIFRGAKQYKNPLNVRWNSVTPYALGSAEVKRNGPPRYPHVVRYALKNCGTNSGEVTSSPDYLAENLAAQLAGGTGCLDFMIQLQKDAQSNPVENALVGWDETQSPFITIARIDIPSQRFDSDAQKQFCENISFNPWHGLKAHRPLGSINRARQQVMKDVSDFRLKANNQPRIEPTGLERF